DRIDPEEAVGGHPGGIAVRENPPNTKMLTGVVGHPRGTEVRRLGTWSVPVRREVLGVSVDEADPPAASPAEQLDPGEDRHATTLEQADASREERDEVGAQPESELELGRSLEEESPLLGIEEREARQVDLLKIRLRLGEVGV